MTAHTGFGLLFEQGCGKTLTAIATFGTLYLQGKIKTVLVVCPASVVVSWQNDLMKFANFNYIAEPLQGEKAKRLKSLQELEEAQNDALKIAIINYESTHRAGIKEALIDFNADMIICDESQKIKTYNSIQSKMLHKLGDNARYKLILSGTPITNNCLDIWSQYRFLDSSVFGKSFFNFKNRYAITGGFQNHQVIGFRDTENLIKKMHSIGYRVAKKDCLDLPEKVFQDYYVELEPKAKRVYLDLKNNCISEINNKSTITASIVLTQLLRLQQIAGGFVNDDEGKLIQVSDAKLNALKEILEDCSEKVVIFALYTAEINAIQCLLDKMKISYVSIDGSVKISDRADIINSFQSNKDIQVFIGQLQSASTGITLTASNLMIFYSVSFNLADWLQASDRIHRIGQKNKCTYISLIAKDTIDSKVHKALKKKENIAISIVDNWRELIN